MRFLQAGLAVLSAVLCSVSIALAQTGATVMGTVTDSSGAVVPQAEVQLQSTEQGTIVEMKTNSAGIYVFPDVKPGQYELKVQKSGFKKVDLLGVVVNVRAHIEQDFRLEPGSVSQTVTVTGGTPAINTQDTSVGTVVDRQFAENMPLNGRSFQSLISLTPGVVITAVNSAAQGQFSVNGQRADSNYFTVDGVSANFGVEPGNSQNSEGGGAGPQTAVTGGYNNMVSVDAMQEFRVTTATFAPEYGQFPGGQIAIVTRSGSNSFHGDVYEYLRNTVLDANNWFTNSIGQPRPPEHQNDYGFVVGGPIQKDKLFFFASYESLRLLVPESAVNNIVPSLCARGTAPSTGPTSCAATGGIAAVSAMQPYLRAWPNPTTACTTCTAAQAPELGFESAAFSNRQNLDAWSLRLDWNPTSKMTFFARGNDSPTSDTTIETPTSSNRRTVLDLKTFTVGQTYILRPTLVNDLRYNYSFVRSFVTQGLTTFGGAVVPASSLLFPSPFNSHTGYFLMAGNSIDFILDGNLGVNYGKQYNIVDSLAWTRGTHQMKFGFNYRRVHPDLTRQPFVSEPLFTSLNITSSNPSGFRWLTNTPNLYVVSSFTPQSFWYTSVGFYAQDAWNITPRLTLTYGFRWDVSPPPNSPPGQGFQALDVVDANYRVDTHVLPAGTPIYHTQWNGIAPRIGVAYQLSRNPHYGRVIRAGYGLFFDSEAAASGFAMAPFIQAVVTDPITMLPPQLPILTATVPSKPTAAPWPFVTTTNPNLRMPYTHEFSLAVAQALGTMQTLTVTYEGAIGRKLIRRDQYPECNSSVNRRCPITPMTNGQFTAGFDAVGNENSSNYNSLQTLYQRHLSHGLLAMASYTYSHCLDDGSFPGGTNALDTFAEPVHDYYGNCDFDIRQSLQAAFSYNVPTPSHNGFVDAVLGHWGLDGIFRARTAPPIDLVDSNAYLAAGMPFLPGGTLSNPGGIATPIRPFVNPGAPIYLYGAQCAAAYQTTGCPGGWALNPGTAHSKSLGIPVAFQVLPANTLVPSMQGTLGRNQLRGFGWNQFDFTLRREFPIHESIKLQFRSDFFNLFNHPAFYMAGNALNVASPAFGKAVLTLNNSAQSGFGFTPRYQIGGPRSMQLSLKLVF